MWIRLYPFPPAPKVPRREKRDMAKEGRILVSAPETVNPRREFPDGRQRILPAVTERIRSYPIDRVGKSGVKADVDRITIDEPLEIRVGGQTLAVTMRTPGHDFELASRGTPGWRSSDF
jgi:hypothetical protein